MARSSLTDPPRALNRAPLPDPLSPDHQLLVLAILGSAVFPAFMGRISDVVAIQRAFIVPLLCDLYILYFGMPGHKAAFARAMRHVRPENEGL
jgi:fucose permease